MESMLPFLPTQQALHAKHITQDNHCPCCQREGEDVLHVMVMCPLAQKVWNSSLIRGWKRTSSSFVDWWSSMIEECEAEELILAAVICWNIWNGRNSMLWQNRQQGEVQIVGSAKSFIADWKHIQEQALPFHTTDKRRNKTKWRLLEPGRLICNVDGAMSSPCRTIGLWICDTG